MPAPKQMLPHAQSYLRGFILLDDEDAHDPMVNWNLPERWDALDYSGTVSDSQIVGNEKLVTETTFNCNALASESSSRQLVADDYIDSGCPFFYFEVSIQAEVPLDAK